MTRSSTEDIQVAGACTICGAVCDTPTGECAACAGLLRWVRGYFAHVSGLAERIAPELRFVEDLGVESLDWMCWPVEAEEKLGVALPDDELERVRTVGDWVRVLRAAGAAWPAGREVRLLPRRGFWSPYRWAAEGASQTPN